MLPFHFTTLSVPASHPFAPAVRSGGLMAYSPNWLPQSERNAQIGDRIVKGAQPRDIPVEQRFRYFPWHQPEDGTRYVADNSKAGPPPGNLAG